MAAIAGDQVDAEAMFTLKSLFDKVGSPHLDCRQDGAKLAKSRASYLFNTTIAGVDYADAILIIGSNPRIEAAVYECAYPQKLSEFTGANCPDWRGDRFNLSSRAFRRRYLGS